MLMELLQMRGFEVVGARDGAAGVASFVEEPADLVLMDMNMPVLDGWQATRQLRALPGAVEVPVIGMSAHSLAGDRDRAIEAGCNAFHTKPLDIDALFETIEAQLAAVAADD